MKKLLFIFVSLMVLSSPAFAYEWVNSNDSKGGYYRDTSNDGYSYNNANTIGANNSSARGRSGVRANVFGSDY